MSNLIETIKEFTSKSVIEGRVYTRKSYDNDYKNDKNIGYINLNNVEATLPSVYDKFARAARLDALDDNHTLFAADLDQSHSFTDAIKICDSLKKMYPTVFTKAVLFISSVDMLGDVKRHLVTNLILPKEKCFEILSSSTLVDTKWVNNCKPENCLFLRVDTKFETELNYKW